MSDSSRALRVALIFGGRSGEHDVSVVSARSVSRALDPTRYQVQPMAIDRDGLWADPDEAERVLATSGDRADQVVAFRGRHRLDPRLLASETDVVMPILHGPFGEDGTIQGLFEILDLPYVGCDHAASALAMDKRMTKRVLAWAGLPTAPWHEVETGSWATGRASHISSMRNLGLPLFVKPSRLGSSVGISKISVPDELEPAVNEALRWDSVVVVERGLDAREIELAVLGDESPRASLPGEVIPGHAFYDYADKYLDTACQLLAPAPLEDTEVAEAQELAVRVFRLLDCAGMARVDLFLDRSDGSWWVNEVNTIPGFTSISMYPRLWTVTGLPYSELLDELIALALARHARSRARKAAD